jgi:hypothetical protein
MIMSFGDKMSNQNLVHILVHVLVLVISVYMTIYITSMLRHSLISAYTSPSFLKRVKGLRVL